MEVELIEIDEIAKFCSCRCCLALSENQMDNISECFFEDLPLQEILSIIAPVPVIDGEIISLFSLLN